MTGGVSPETVFSGRIHPLAIGAALLLHGAAIALLLDTSHVAPRPITVTLSLAGAPSIAGKAAVAGPALPAAVAPAPLAAAVAPAPVERPAVPAPPPTAEVPPPIEMRPQAPAPPLSAQSATAPPPAAPALAEAQPLPKRLPLPPSAPARPPPPQKAVAPGSSPVLHAASRRAAPQVRSGMPAPETTGAAPQSAASTIEPGAAGGPAATIASSWSAALNAWLDSHKFYPDLARRRGEQGMVEIRFTVARDGRVLSVAVARASGSSILDRAAQNLLRGARLPPFPPGMQGAEATVTVPIRYVLEP